MSKFKIVKTLLVVGSLCAGLWQAAKFMEILSETKGQQASRGPASILNSLGLPGIQSAGATPGLDPQQLLKQIQEGVKPGADGSETVAQPKEMVIFSPDGKKLTPEQMEKLKREAERNRPKVPTSQPAKTRP